MRFTFPVIPGRAEGANPESRVTGTEFAALDSGFADFPPAPRNDQSR
jgi:hypothetical protein